MFAFYKIINNYSKLELENLEFHRKCKSLNDFKLTPNQRINKYILMMKGWCFVTTLDEIGNTTPKYLVIDTDFENQLDNNIVSIFRDLKLEEILDF
jgi:hypothetical protein